MVQQASLRLHRDRKRKDSFVAVDDAVGSNSSVAALVEEAEVRIEDLKEDMPGMVRRVVVVIVGLHHNPWTPHKVGRLFQL